jgi:hypothetical protein
MFFGALQIYLQQLCQLQNVLIIIIVNLVYNKDSLVSGVLNNLWLYWSAIFIGTSVIAFMFSQQTYNGIYAELRRIANYASGTNCKY